MINREYPDDYVFTEEEIKKFEAMGIKPIALYDEDEIKTSLTEDDRLSISEDTTASNLAKENIAKVKKLKAPKTSQAFSVLREVPQTIVKIAYAAFPAAKNQTDAVVAYLFCNCPEIAMSNEAIFALTDAQKALIQNYGESAFSDFSSKLKQMMKKLDKLSNENSFNEMMLAHFVYDYMAISTPNHKYRPENGKNFDITDNGRFLDFLDDMKLAWKKYKQQTDYRDGARW